MNNIILNSTTIKTNTSIFDYNTLSNIDIEDIAISLSNNCRFNGHITEFYSVAQHSVLVYEGLKYYDTANRDTVFWGLLHDAHEAYVTDLPRPLKKYLEQNNVTIFSELEKEIDKKIAEISGINLDNVDFKLVKKWDNILLDNELYYLMSNKIHINEKICNFRFSSPKFDMIYEGLTNYTDLISNSQYYWREKFLSIFNTELNANAQEKYVEV